MTDAPDAAMGFVAVWIRGGNFVVGNYLIIPIGNVEAAVGAKFNVHRAEPIIG